MTADPAEREALAERVLIEARARADRMQIGGARAMLLQAAERRAEKVRAGLPVDLAYLRLKLPRKKRKKPAPSVPRDLRGADDGPRPTTRRPCLRCRNPFDSHGPGNRLCDPCRARSSDASPYEV